MYGLVSSYSVLGHSWPASIVYIGNEMPALLKYTVALLWFRKHIGVNRI